MAAATEISAAVLSEPDGIFTLKEHKNVTKGFSHCRALARVPLNTWSDDERLKRSDWPT